jgi:hypothetical protein
LARQRVFIETTKNTKNTKAGRSPSRRCATMRLFVSFVFFVVSNDRACGAQGVAGSGALQRLPRISRFSYLSPAASKRSQARAFAPSFCFRPRFA